MEDKRKRKGKDHPNHKEKSDHFAHLSVTIEKEDFVNLRNLAKEADVNLSWVVRHCIRHGFKKLKVEELKKKSKKDALSVQRKELKVV